MHNERDARSPQWKKPYEAAILELDPTKLERRISEAGQAILNRVEELLTRPSNSEQHALNDALRNLRSLRIRSPRRTSRLLHVPRLNREEPSDRTEYVSILLGDQVKQGPSQVRSRGLIYLDDRRARAA